MSDLHEVEAQTDARVAEVLADHFDPRQIARQAYLQGRRDGMLVAQRIYDPVAAAIREIKP